MHQIFFQCLTCHHYNRENLRMPKFEAKKIEFDSFSGAWEHMMENRNHYMTTVIREESGNE